MSFVHDSKLPLRGDGENLWRRAVSQIPSALAIGRSTETAADPRVGATGRPEGASRESSGSA